VSTLFGHGHGVLWTAGGLIIVIAFGVIYVWTLLAAVGRSAQAGLAAIVALAVLSCTIYGSQWTSLWIYVSAAVGMVLAAGPGGRRVAMRGVIAVTAAYIFFGWLTHDDASDFFVIAIPVLLIGLAMIGFRLQMQLMNELAQARETVAKLAANDERLRLARDMHDLTGQSLSTITLKAELAAKRLARLDPSADRDAALRDLTDIGGSAARRCTTSARRSAATVARLWPSRPSPQATRCPPPGSSSTTTPR
jgi:two-component system sensor histidine kinase DesK